MKKTAKDTAEIAKLDIKKAVEKSRYPCIIHFDGKTLFEMNQGKRLKNERLAVLVNIAGGVTSSWSTCLAVFFR